MVTERWKKRAVIDPVARVVLDMSAGLRWIETDRVQTAATDGVVLLVNPRFFSSLSFEQQTGLILHECLHVRQKHHRRAEFFGVLPREANVAMDVEINQIVRGAGYELPPDGHFPESHKLEPWRTWEHYYRILSSRHKDECDEGGEGEQGESGSQQGAGGASSGGGDDQQGQDDQQQQQDQQRHEEESQGSGGCADSVADGVHSTGSLAEEFGVAEGEIEQAADEAESIAEAASQQKPELSEAIDNATNQRGAGAGTSEVAASDTIEAGADWQDVIIEALRGGPEFGTDWSQRSRRSHAIGAHLPRRCRRRNGMKVALVVDVSGSCIGWLNHWQALANEMIDELPIKDMVVVYHDDGVRKVEEWSQGEEVTIASEGGGGTSHVEALAEAIEHDPDVILCFTDCWSVFPEEPDVPVFWIDPWNQREIPYGTRIVPTF